MFIGYIAHFSLLLTRKFSKLIQFKVFGEKQPLQNINFLRTLLLLFNFISLINFSNRNTVINVIFSSQNKFRIDEVTVIVRSCFLIYFINRSPTHLTFVMQTNIMAQNIAFTRPLLSCRCKSTQHSNFFIFCTLLKRARKCFTCDCFLGFLWSISHTY